MAHNTEKSYQDHLCDIYHGEEFGVVMFQTAADITKDKQVKEKLLVLKRLEEEVIRLLTPLAEKHGIAKASGSYLSRAKQTGQALGTNDWKKELKKMAKLVDGCIADYAAAVPLAPPEDQERIRFAVAHEGVIGQFIAKELAGQDEPLSPVTDFIAALHNIPPYSG
ncbi:MAG: hypothetical protein EP349_10250 [Alphaproteobacteria bacterium]|nr:MAG: hypothetical protein EP349_10250 [Alphaproteobacteria bacterium]